MKNNKMYSIVFPIWSLLIYPIVWIAILPINVVIDTIVLLIGFKYLKINNAFEKYKKVIINVWLFGILSVIIGSLVLLIPFGNAGSVYSKISSGIIWSPYENVAYILSIVLAILISMILIYIFNYRVSFKKVGLERKKAKKLALLLAIFTAPWMLLCPINIVYNSMGETIVNSETQTDEIRDTLNDLEFSSYIQDGVYDSENLMVSIDCDLISKDEVKLSEYKNLFESNSTNNLLNKNAEKIFKKLDCVADVVFKVSGTKTYEFSRTN